MIVIVFLLNLATVFAINPLQAPDAISYYRYRLIYKINTTALPNGVNTTNFYVRIDIPNYIINNIFSYYNNHGYEFRDSSYPRVFYLYKDNSQRLLRTYLNDSSGKTVYVFIDSLNTTLGNEQYLIVYIPLYFYEDFEYSPIGSWTTHFFSDDRWTSDGTFQIISSITDTSRKCINPSGSNVWREVNITISGNKALTSSFDVKSGCYIGFVFLKNDNTTIEMVYGHSYYKAGCSKVVGDHTETNVLQDVWNFCGVPVEDIKMLWKINLHGSCSGVDNIMVVPPDVSSFG